MQGVNGIEDRVSGAGGRVQGPDTMCERYRV